MGCQSAVEAQAFPDVPIDNQRQRVLSAEHATLYNTLEQRDLNADGGIDFVEYSKVDWLFRLRYDYDKDSVLTWAEFASGTCAIPRTASVDVFTKKCLATNLAKFERLDRSRDSKVSEVEVQPLVREFFSASKLCSDGKLRPGKDC